MLSVDRLERRMAVGLYIHVPFCKSRCHFCAFYLQIHRTERAQAYLESLCTEIELHARHGTLNHRPLRTVYFGGGTPTSLEPHQLEAILQTVAAKLTLSSDAEITVEAHPDTLTAEGLHHLVRAGFNRLSIGVQTLDEEELRRVGRPGIPATVRGAVQNGRDAGFGNINLDVMYGLPNQTMASWQATLDDVLMLQPTHVSCYALTVEERTVLARTITRHPREAPDADLQNTMEDEAETRLGHHGFQRYEISNYCRPGFGCQHNLLYWQGAQYLGLGPSAHSYVDGVRFSNVEDLDAYRGRLSAGRLPIIDHESLSPLQQRREAVVFGLRLTDGVPLTDLSDVAGEESRQRFDHLLHTGLLETKNGRVRLTSTGRRFADSVAVDLL